jgi:NADH-quinone oxidoreductase subunit N
MDILSSLQIAGPEVFLAGYGLLAVLLGAVLGDGFSKYSNPLSALALTVAAALALMQAQAGPQTAFGGVYAIDGFGAYAKCVALLMAAASLQLSTHYLVTEKLQRYEYALLIVFASIGMGVMLSAGNLMTVYMGVEMLSLPSYILAAFNRDSRRSSEAGLKYFVLGALASGLLLFGMSLVYGFAGSAAFTDIAQADMTVGMIFGLVLMITGLAFKASAAPFHVWTPDVYEGAPTPVVAFFATAPKMATVGLFASVLFGPFAGRIEQWQDVVAIIAAASLLVGAFGALGQNNLKRLLAYSSIANVGFALVAVSVGREVGGSAVLTFMTLYVLASLGLFAALLAMRRSDGMVEDISDLAGLAQTRPAFAVAFTVLILSVAGFPPLAGFLGKWEVFRAGYEGGLVWLLIVAVVSTVVAFAYYLRIVKVMWFDKPASPFVTMPASLALTVYGTAALSGIVIVLFFERVIGSTLYALAG